MNTYVLTLKACSIQVPCVMSKVIVPKEIMNSTSAVGMDKLFCRVNLNVSEFNVNIF